MRGFDASDLAINLLQRRQPRPDGTYTVATLSNFLEEYTGPRFDLIVSYGLFHCLPTQSRLLSHEALANLLQPGGLMLFSTLTARLPWPEGHGPVAYRLALPAELARIRAIGRCLYAEEGTIVEDHAPVIGTHRHSSAWLVLEKQ
jgi:2-polyprenyl-3-methyl-5-hydroxy-6-metoxy-1,4-benzoquinol methylase